MRYWWVRLMIAFMLAAPALASPVADFTALLNNTQTMQADFKQTIYDDRNKVLQSASGAMAFARPGKFYWQLKRPVAQLMIANGSKLWIYDPDLQQVIIRSLSQAAGEAPALLLSHVSTSLTDDFIITEINLPQKNMRWFQLKPRKKDKMFEVVTMGFMNHQIHEMHMQDQLGHQTKIQFKQTKINQPIASNVFIFKPPPHVDVIDESHDRK